MNHQLYSRALVNATALDRRGQHAGRIQHGYHGTALVSINAEKDKTLTVEVRAIFNEILSFRGISFRARARVP